MFICHCEQIDETRAPLETILQAIPGSHDLLIYECDSDNYGGLQAASWLISRFQVGDDIWPRRHTAREVLKMLRSAGIIEGRYPLQRYVLYAWSASANRGAIWPLYGNDVMSRWADVVSADIPRYAIVDYEDENDDLFYGIEPLEE